MPDEALEILAHKSERALQRRPMIPKWITIIPGSRSVGTDEDGPRKWSFRPAILADRLGSGRRRCHATRDVRETAAGSSASFLGGRCSPAVCSFSGYLPRLCYFTAATSCQFSISCFAARRWAALGRLCAGSLPQVVECFVPAMRIFLCIWVRV